ncbi:MAG: DUF2520 domain-containing protein [Acinetobacter sp.]
MKISLIGSGRVATHLSKKLHSVRHQIQYVYSPQIQHAQILADQVNAIATDDLTKIENDVDVIFIAVKDQAIIDVVNQFPKHLANVLIVHTSGSTTLDILSSASSRYAVFYPLQTFSLEKEVDWLSIPLLIESYRSQDLDILFNLANSLSNKVFNYSTEQRLNLHLAAVFANNFSNYCYDIAKQIVDMNGVDYRLLHPLILETAQKAMQFSPEIVQTGPAKRGDHTILQSHQQLLLKQGQGDFLQVYNLLTQLIQKR